MSRRGARRERPRPRPRARVAIDPAWVRRAARAAAVVAALAAALFAGVPLVRRVAHTHPYFAVREVVIRHRGELDEPALRALSGIVPGMNVWEVDTDAAVTRLLTNGWVRAASVHRALPDRVVVAVREHRPRAILAVADESPGLYYLAATGRIFAPVAPGDGRDLPLVTGLTRADLGGGAAFGPRAVRRALALLRRAERYRTLAAASEVHVDRTRGLTLMPVRPALPIEIGWGGYDEKLARLAEVLPRLAGREAELRSASCVFDDEVIVRTRAAGPPAPGAKRRGQAGTTRGTKAAPRAAVGA